MAGSDKMTLDVRPETLASTVEWVGDLNDDCTASWEGLTLRAERMRRVSWWWAVYDETGEVACSADSDVHVPTGKKARAAAEHAAKEWLYARDEPAKSKVDDE
jgi:hypothetical protein